MTKNIRSIRQRAYAVPCKIVLVDGEDDRVLLACEELAANSRIIPVLIGRENQIQSRIRSLGLTIQPEVHHPSQSGLLERFAQLINQKRMEKGKTPLQLEECMEKVRDPSYFAAMLLETRQVDGMLGGSALPTAAVLKAGLDIIGMADDASIISGSFAMFLPKELPAGQQVLIFSDCAVVPSPTPEQLSSIAANAVKVARNVLGLDPLVAFLSFSTKGSAEHPLVEQVKTARQTLLQHYPHVLADGELQADAALIPEISSRKSPQSIIGGKANILIFPDLNAGNIAYKMVERLAGAKALGVILEGFRRPLNDLSRGCSMEDVIDMICVTALQTQGEKNIQKFQVSS